MLYVATTSGVAALALDDPDHPAIAGGRRLAVVRRDRRRERISVASAGHVYVASGYAGVVDLDMRTAGGAGHLGNLAAMLAPGQVINAVDVVVSKMPGQTWLLVARRDRRYVGPQARQPQDRARALLPGSDRASGCLLDMDFLDATVSGRDPSFDPVTGTFDAVTTDPSSRHVLPPGARRSSSGKRLARPAIWEQLNTLTGRRCATRSCRARARCRCGHAEDAQRPGLRVDRRLARTG